MSSELYFGNFAFSPSDGFVDFPWPTASGRMIKYFFASSGWPSPNSSPAKAGVSIEAPDPPVPCSTTTGSPVGSPTVL
jgi:hypothetical protein